MFFFGLGLPGGFAEWCDAVILELARRALGPTELIRADTLGQIALSVIATGASQAVVSSRQPGGRLRAALVENRRTFIVALDDPGLALADLVLGDGVDLVAATQAVASSYGALIGCRAAPGALTLHSGRDWPQQAATAAAIARHLQIAVNDVEIADLVATLAAGDAARPRHDAVAWRSSLSAADQKMIGGALMPYIEHQANGDSLSITWAHELFFRGDRPTERAIGPVDITGRARCQLNGPHIILPPGSWSLSLTMLFARGAAEHEFHVEICTDRPLASGAIRPQQEDSATINLDFVLDNLAEQPISIRVSSMRAAFDGAITLAGTTLVRMATAAAAAAGE